MFLASGAAHRFLCNFSCRRADNNGLGILATQLVDKGLHNIKDVDAGFCWEFRSQVTCHRQAHGSEADEANIGSFDTAHTEELRTC